MWDCREKGESIKIHSGTKGLCVGRRGQCVGMWGGKGVWIGKEDSKRFAVVYESFLEFPEMTVKI